MRHLEAQVALEYGVDTPAYWRAVSDRLSHRLATNRFAPVNGRYASAEAERAHRWLIRVTAAYRALARASVN